MFNKIIYFTQFNGVEVYSYQLSDQIKDLMEDEIIDRLTHGYNLNVVDVFEIRRVVNDVIKRHVHPTIDFQIHIDTSSY